jgi:hypothetical protein
MMSADKNRILPDIVLSPRGSTYDRTIDPNS